MKDNLTETKEEGNVETCPNCDAKVTFKEKDGYIEFWDCPNCGKINLKKEQWKKMILTPSTLPDVHESCNFCKNKHSDKCPATLAENCKFYEENKNISHADKIVMLIDNEEPRFFNDQYGNCFVWINDNTIQKTLDIHGGEFKNLIIDKFYRTFGKVPKSDNIKDALCAFEAIARNEQTITLRTRINTVTGQNGLEIWIDRCNNCYQSIKLTKNGFEHVDKTPPLFRRYEHMKELPIPKDYDGKDAKNGNFQDFYHPPSLLSSKKIEEGEGEKSFKTPSLASLPSFKYLWKIFDYLRILDSDKILIIASLVSDFFIGYPYIIVYIHGSSGKGKSVGSKCVRSLLDPSTILDVGLPKKSDELLQKIDHHYFCFFDNVGYISDEFSDIFCRVSTGGGMSKRKLYTDNTDFYRQLKRVLWFNGISVEITKEDMLKRTILVEVLPLTGKEKTEEELFREFEEIRPHNLYDLYILVSEVIKRLPDITPKKLFRMADYTKIGCATAEALGYDQDFFLDAYETKLTDQIKELIWNNTVGSVLYDWINSHVEQEWCGTPTALFKLIKNHAKDEMGVSTRARDFPKSPPHLTRKINLLTEAFEKIGIEIVHTEGTIREWHIIKHILKPQHPEDSESIEEPTIQESDAVIDVDSPNGELRSCYNCKKTIRDHNELTNWSGQFYCKKCLDKILAQRPKTVESWKCPKLGHLDGKPFCIPSKLVLENCDNCTPECSFIREDSV